MIIYVFVSIASIYVIAYVNYIYTCYMEHKKIKKLEDDFKLHSDNIFYLTICKILIDNNFIHEFVSVDKIMEIAVIIYKENQLFRIECYRNGIKPRLLEYMNKKI